jgi:ankyrin repeat protein
MEDLSIFKDNDKKYDKKFAEEVRKIHLKNLLNNNQKLEIYTCSVDGDVNKLKKLIEENKYNLFEEVSAKGYFWTALHYAAHYGHTNIVEYILEEISDNPYKKDLANLQSNLGYTPLFVAITSSLDEKKKKNTLDVYLKYDMIDFNIVDNNGSDIFDVCKKNKLQEYLLMNLRED